MAVKTPFMGSTLSDDALDRVVGGLSHQSGTVDAHPELNHPNASHGEGSHPPNPASDGKAPQVGDAKHSLSEGKYGLNAGTTGGQYAGEKDELDPWDDSLVEERSEMAEVAFEAFSQAWNDGDTDLTPEEAFQVAAEAIEEMMESAGLPMDNFETDKEMAFEVFTNAIEDGEDPSDAFELAREAIEEASRGNFAESDSNN